MANRLRKSKIGIDFSPLNGSFKRPTITPSDIDGVVEVGGSILFFECKHPHDPHMKLGQRILLERLSVLPNCSSLLVFLTGNRDPDSAALLFQPVSYQVCRDGVWENKKDTTLEDFRLMCGRFGK